MKRIFSKQEVIDIGNKLAKANFVATYKPRSHSHNVFSLFPQTEAQYNWLKRKRGTTYNVIILYTIEEVLKEVPELRDNIRPTKSGRFCRIDITL
jgi:hypothetical protein